jgi:hypothetical protein
MPSFKFDAIDVSGGQVWGFVDATTEHGAIEMIKGMGYFPWRTTKVARKGGIARVVVTVRRMIVHLFRGCVVRPKCAQVFSGRWIQPKSKEELNGILAALMRCNLTSQQVEEARLKYRKPQASLLDTLVELGFASPRELLSAAAEYYGLEYIDLSNFEPSASMLRQVRESLVREYLFVPLNEESGILKIAVTHPSDAGEVRAALNREVVPMLALREQLIEAINRSYENVEQGAAADRPRE